MSTGPRKTLPIKILGSTGERKYFLDSMTGSKYIPINGEDSQIVDVRALAS